MAVIREFETKNILISKIVDNPFQTRSKISNESIRTLVNSIRDRGLFNPITVLKDNEKFIVVHGHRRLAAYKRLKFSTIPAFVKLRTLGNALITDMIHENLIREDLTVQEKARSIKLLFSQLKSLDNNVDNMISCITAGKMYVQRKISEREKEISRRSKTKFTEGDMFQGMKYLKEIGMSANNAISYLTLLKLPGPIQKLVGFNERNDLGDHSNKKISIRMACNLSRVDDPLFQKVLLQRALSGTNARHIDALISNYKIKVLKGEWKGIVKKSNNSKVIHELNRDTFIELTEKCAALSKRINSWKLTKLSALADTLDKDIFIGAAVALRKEIRLLDNQLKEKLVEKEYKNIEHSKLNKVFEIQIKTMRDKGMVRGTIPMNLLKDVGLTKERLKNGDFVQLKIVGIRNAEVKP